MARIPATNQTPPSPLPLFSHYFYNKSNIEIVVKNLCVCVCVCVLSHFSHVQLLVILRTVPRQAPLSLGFSRQEYWSGLPFP